MPEATVVIRESGDREIELLVNGKRLIAANYDEHGWSGLQLLEDTAKAMAEELGLRFEHQ